MLFRRLSYRRFHFLLLLGDGRRFYRPVILLAEALPVLAYRPKMLIQSLEGRLHI